jgi:hypothetical protein
VFDRVRIVVRRGKVRIQLIEPCATAKDQVVAIFHLGKEELMPAAVLAPFWTTKRWNQALQFSSHGQQGAGNRMATLTS